MTNIDPTQVRAYLARPLEDLEAELALYAPTARGPAEAWQKIAGPVRVWICDDWGWCRERQSGDFDELYDLAIAVAVVLSRHISQMPLDADECLIAAILVKRGLDGFCGC